MKAFFIYPPPWAPWAPSYGAALLFAAAKRNGHVMLPIDLNIELHNSVAAANRPWWADDKAQQWSDEAFLNGLWADQAGVLDPIVAKIAGSGPPLCAFSVHSSSVAFALLMARKVKQRNAAITILFGGPHCFRSEGGLEILNHPCVDAICTGEGDVAWPSLLDAFEKNGNQLSDVRGICYKRPDGSIVDCGDPELVGDLDSLPFADFSWADSSQYSITNRLCLMMSRGCINRCAYCSEGPNFKKYRCRSADSLFEEVRQNVERMTRSFPIPWLGKKKPPPYINFNDSLINGCPEMLEAFCDRIIREGLTCSWGGMAVFRKEMTRGLLAKMKQAGFREVMWGLESGCDDTLRLMNKNIFTTEIAERIINDAAELGIQQYANIIVGFPGETEPMFLETLAFVVRNMRHFRRLGLPLMEIRKNSRVYDKYAEYGVESPLPVTWQSADHVNTYDLRMARRKLLATLIESKLFDQGRYTESPQAAKCSAS
jgi:anaerobic magnesium-protoporphyrin IX monomethyl ester cyclase